VGDFTDDGNSDLIVRANGWPLSRRAQLWLAATVPVAAEPQRVVFWVHPGRRQHSTYTEFFSAGDWDGDGVGDLFVRSRRTNGTLKLFRGTGRRFKAALTKGTGWNYYNELFGSFGPDRDASRRSSALCVQR
jgi:hypothetical protein